jgi:hypothetical protein
MLRWKAVATSELALAPFLPMPAGAEQFPEAMPPEAQVADRRMPVTLAAICSMRPRRRQGRAGPRIRPYHPEP